MTILITVPTTELLDALTAVLPDTNIRLWDVTGQAPAGHISMVVAPYMIPAANLAPLAGIDVDVLQLQSIGYDGVAAVVGADVVICNAAGAHEEATAELALALVLASRRGIPNFVRAQDRSSWEQQFTIGVRGQRATIIGAGGIGTATARRLEACGVSVTRVGRSARTDDFGSIASITDLPRLLPQTDIVVLAVPLDDSTVGLVDADFLAALPDNALIVNVARGPVVDTEALMVELESGRLWAALDVVDPEPLPSAHPLWSNPHAVIVPHVGGRVSTMHADLSDLIGRQIAALFRDEKVVNVVAGATSAFEKHALIS